MPQIELQRVDIFGSLTIIPFEKRHGKNFKFFFFFIKNIHKLVTFAISFVCNLHDGNNNPNNLAQYYWYIV